MKTIVLTGYAGDSFASMAKRTVPLFMEYARKHGAAFECRCLYGSRPASWMKIPSIVQCLNGYDAVLWVDIDVVIVDSSENIFDSLGDKAHGLVEHKTDCGLVPNCGVWIVTKAMRPVLLSMWESNRHIDHQWWEQASLLECMGYDVKGTSSTLSSPTPVYEAAAFLPQQWNHHPHDERRVPIEDARFVHVTQYDDRVSAVATFADRSK